VAFPASTLILLAVVVLAGAASYFIIERPTQNLRHLFDREGYLVDRYREQ
jgi:peptidoglycan/LPS O-acetylase OafA/YrhL